MQLNNNIKLIRELSGMTQNDFADLFGNVSKDMLYTYESGKANPNELFKSRVAMIAGIDIKSLETVELKESDIKLVSRQELKPGMFTMNTSAGKSLRINGEKPVNQPSEPLQQTVADQAATIKMLTELLARKLENS